MLVERAVVPETFFAATNAAVAGLNRITGAFVPLHNRAGVVGDGPFAAHLVQAISFTRVIVVPRFHEQAGIVIGAPIACVVNAAAVEFLWPALAVKRWNLSEDEQMGDNAHHHVGNRRASGYVDDGLVHELVNRRSASWIWLRGLHATV